MSLQITKIEIKNFRSIRNLALTPSSLAILVGKNDCGKSNVLRAMNLFFKNKTDDSVELDFGTDHNVFNQPQKRAKEISIELEIDLPASYRETNGDYIVWEKRWRSNGLVRNEYLGYYRVSGPRGGVHRKPKIIPKQSNLHTLLRNIKFIYVPAIKDIQYFSRLRASIHNVIAQVADEEFRDSSQDFERAIAGQLNDLTTQIQNSLGLRSRLALPKDLSHIFESLDFLSEGQNISLNARGDGIKARHIPLILKFIADKNKELQVRGKPPYTFIWAYEEPENSLEIANSIELADQFKEFLHQGISQIFLTTHSPVFYNLYQNETDGVQQISCHRMFYKSNNEGTKETAELSNLDQDMGTMDLFLPMVRKIEEETRQLEKAKADAERLTQANQRNLFVEGPSDKKIIAKAIKVFAPNRAADINVETKERAGVSHIGDMLREWIKSARFNPALPLAAALVDSDEAGQGLAKSFGNEEKSKGRVRCFTIPTPPHIKPVLDAGYIVPVILETLYDEKAWKWAEDQGFLEDQAILDVLSDELKIRFAKEKTNLDEHLKDEWSIFVLKKFHQGGKGPAAQHFSEMDDDKFRERFPFLEPLIKEIVSYLFPQKETS